MVVATVVGRAWLAWPTGISGGETKGLVGGTKKVRSKSVPIGSSRTDNRYGRTRSRLKVVTDGYSPVPRHPSSTMLQSHGMTSRSASAVNNGNLRT